MENNKYQVGDDVLILIPDTGDKVLGKIEEIYMESDEKAIRYNEYYFPEKIKCILKI